MGVVITTICDHALYQLAQVWAIPHKPRTHLSSARLRALFPVLAVCGTPTNIVPSGFIIWAGATTDSCGLKGLQFSHSESCVKS